MWRGMLGVLGVLSVLRWIHVWLAGLGGWLAGWGGVGGWGVLFGAVVGVAVAAAAVEVFAGLVAGTVLLIPVKLL